MIYLWTRTGTRGGPRAGVKEHVGQLPAGLTDFKTHGHVSIQGMEDRKQKIVGGTTPPCPARPFACLSTLSFRLGVTNVLVNSSKNSKLAG